MRGLCVGLFAALAIALAGCSGSAASPSSERSSGGQTSSGTTGQISLGKFTLTLNAMADSRSFHSALLLPDGRVLIVGGKAKGVSEWPIVHRRTEIYNPATGAWMETGEMVNERQSPAVALLPDGRVIVAGGTNTSIDPYNSTEVWDPATGQWSDAGDMSNYRETPQAVTLKDGRPLVTGGRSKTFRPLADVEVW
ncbi:MAG: hypothetical protein FJ317_05330, partial [SAR202 cluster bacterium]|nr:hypothetical protein [SAR202 cluster bacterium]